VRDNLIEPKKPADFQPGAAGSFAEQLDAAGMDGGSAWQAPTSAGAHRVPPLLRTLAHIRVRFRLQTVTASGSTCAARSRCSTDTPGIPS